MWTCFLLVALSIVCRLADAGYCTSHFPCTKACSYSAKDTKKCGWLGLKRCTYYSTAYHGCPNTCYKRACCPCYTGSNCQTPTCFGSTNCPNGGRCTSPDMCECKTGFSAPRCTDIDECATTTHGCQHECMNTIGSYECTCRRGYTLDCNQRSCSACPAPNWPIAQFEQMVPVQDAPVLLHRVSIEKNEFESEWDPAEGS